jgi:hypothetical protein
VWDKIRLFKRARVENHRSVPIPIALEQIQEWAWSGLRSSQFDFSLGLSKEHFIETVKNILRAKKVESDVEPVRKGHFGEPAAASCVFR